jgi:hypothetical protein
MKPLKFALFSLVLSVFAVSCQSNDGGAAQSNTPDAAAQPSDQSYDAPIGPTTTVTFDESQISFGTIPEGEVVNQVFTFKNTGTEPLILSDARGSCGCTVPAWPKEPIAPGETGEITVQFNSAAKKGKRSQKVTITANTNPPQTFIYLTGEVIGGPEAN